MVNKVVFQPGETTARHCGLWQWDYGQVLEIHGLDLPPAVEVHFAAENSTEDATIRIGTTVDKVTTVAIPEKYLERSGNMVAYIYLSNPESGQTEYRILYGVKARQKPEAFECPEDAELFRYAIVAVNAAADRAESAVLAVQESGKEAIQEAVAKASEAAENATTATQKAVEATGRAIEAAETAITASGALERAETAEKNAKEYAVRAEMAERNVQNFVNTLPLRIISFTASKPTPQEKGTGVTITATADGGNGTLQYRFYRLEPANATIRVFRDWAVSNKTACNPGAGVFLLYVEAMDDTGNYTTAQMLFEWTDTAVPANVAE